MRILPAIPAVFLLVSLATSAQAEQRMFIVANDADGYGVDRCLASGARCGAAAADAYCRTKDFAEAATYHKVDLDEVTGAAPGNAGGCRDNTCEVVAIICTR